MQMGKAHVPSKGNMIIFVLSALRIFFCCAIALGMIHDMLESSSWLKKGLERFPWDHFFPRCGVTVRIDDSVTQLCTSATQSPQCDQMRRD